MDTFFCKTQNTHTHVACRMSHAQHSNLRTQDSYATKSCNQHHTFVIMEKPKQSHSVKFRPVITDQDHLIICINQ